MEANIYGKGIQSLLGYCRRAITDYNMIQDGDSIAVGVSGGKDSVLLLAALSQVRKFIGINYNIVALTIDPCFNNKETDYQKITQLCDELGIKHIIRRSELGDIIFNIRQESNPCSLCARMRRGMLHDLTKEHGCNKLALGHHSDDAVETFMMNLFNEGSIGCFQPVTWLSRKEITMIRPLCLMPEKEILSTLRKTNLPVVKSACPVDGKTGREDMKNFLSELEKGQYPAVRKLIFGALKRSGINGW